jgi:hypothetical protein
LGTNDVYVEVGGSRVFAGALQWPGWCRSGRGEQEALEALIEAGPRYAKVLAGTKIAFRPPKRASMLNLVEKLKGSSSTDFGTPGRVPSADSEPMSPAELRKQLRIVRACWKAFDEAVKRAEGKTLATGPRGGGRDIARMTKHVLEGEYGILNSLGGRLNAEEHNESEMLQALHDAFVEAVQMRETGELPDRGPRGGVRWTARYAMRHAAWHILDHAWELEDRASGLWKGQ